MCVGLKLDLVKCLSHSLISAQVYELGFSLAWNNVCSASLNTRWSFPFTELTPTNSRWQTLSLYTHLLIIQIYFYAENPFLISDCSNQFQGPFLLYFLTQDNIRNLSAYSWLLPLASIDIHKMVSLLIIRGHIWSSQQSTCLMRKLQKSDCSHYPYTDGCEENHI